MCKQTNVKKTVVKRCSELHNNEAISTNVLIKTYSTFFIKKVQDAEFIFNEINARLVVMEINERPRDLLTHVFLLLQFEHML